MTKQSGLGLIEVMVAVIVIAVLAAAGYLFMQGLSKQNDTAQNSSSESASESHDGHENHEDMMAHWQTFTSEKYDFTFRHPENWTVSETADANFPDKANIVVKNNSGTEVLGFYGYLGTGCESNPTGNEPTQKVTVGDTEVEVAKDCNNNWNWINADTKDGTKLTITTWNFVGKAEQEDALMLLGSVNGLTHIEANRPMADSM